MRHRKKNRKFSRPLAQRKALVKSLLRALVINERIITTQAKAKALKRWADKLITWAKKDTLYHRRLSFRILNDHNLVKRLFESIGPRFKDTNGGYTRLFDLYYRRGDGSKRAVLELTKIEKKKVHRIKEKREKERPRKEEKRIAPRKEEKPKKGFISSVRKIFKKERDAL
jgi:large subunit ribosomal protein L17